MRRAGDDDPVPRPPRPARVVRTGLALIHEGETIRPAAGSAAELLPEGDEPAVVLSFPVEVTVVGEIGEEEMRRIADYIYTDLAEALAARS